MDGEMETINNILDILKKIKNILNYSKFYAHYQDVGQRYINIPISLLEKK
jgi:hypothetical protein